MELDRDRIERQDFAQARRGYDPEEVNRHLAAVADAIEQLHERAPREEKTPSLAGAAADQVRTIVEAAERSAAEIESSARSEAERVLSEAKRNAESERSEAAAQAEQERSAAATDARRTRDQAESDAREHVARVQEAATAMTSRAETVESDLNSLVEQLRSSISSLLESVRANAGSLESELVEIQAGLAVIREAPSDRKDEEADVENAVDEAAVLDEPATAAGDDDLREDEGGVTTEYALEDIEAELEPEEPAPEEPEAEEDVEDPRSSEEGGEGARLIALNMALNGTPREETARYLDENFDLDDPKAILDEVYARVGG